MGAPFFFSATAIMEWLQYIECDTTENTGFANDCCSSEVASQEKGLRGPGAAAPPSISALLLKWCATQKVVGTIVSVLAPEPCLGGCAWNSESLPKELISFVSQCEKVQA